MKSLNGTKIGNSIWILCSLMLSGLLGRTSMSLAAEDTWTYKADMPTARVFTGGCVLDGKIYVIGGAPSQSATSAVDMYDPIADTWTRMANMPSARCYHATCTFDGDVYVFGGTPGVWSSANKNVYVYDPQIDSWTQKVDMPYAIGSSGIVVVDNMIYLIGGMLSASSPPVQTVMAYNPMTETWTQKADMPTARSGLSTSAVNGKIYAIGGCKQDWQTFSYKIVEVYDPSTNTWTSKQDMPTARWGLGACVVKGSIYAIGGCSNGLQASTANEVYDPATDTWTTKSPMQQKRYGLYVGSVGDKIYAIGGSVPPMLSTVEEYDTGLTIPSPDFNGDGKVDIEDLIILIEHWGQDEPSVDIAPPPFGDGIVDRLDLELFISYWEQENFPELPEVNVNEEDDGMEFVLKLGQVLVVTLESNPSTGYSWEVVENQDSILEQIGEAEYKPVEQTDPPMVGAGGWEIFRFKATSAGQETLNLVYRRSWETDVEPIKTFSIDVTVN
jgi:predicted secreted protein/N-acetylneuraminic acid mutarotase